MDDAQIELNTAIDIARTALARWHDDPTTENFRVYRDASEIAIKWHRACRLGSGESSKTDDELDALLAG